MLAPERTTPLGVGVGVLMPQRWAARRLTVLLISGSLMPRQISGFLDSDEDMESLFLVVRR